MSNFLTVVKPRNLLGRFSELVARYHGGEIAPVATRVTQTFLVGVALAVPAAGLLGPGTAGNTVTFLLALLAVGTFFSVQYALHGLRLAQDFMSDDPEIFLSLLERTEDKSPGYLLMLAGLFGSVVAGIAASAPALAIIAGVGIMMMNIYCLGHLQQWIVYARDNVNFKKFNGGYYRATNRRG